MTFRIKSIKIKNFKNINSSYIEFSNLTDSAFDAKSRITGIYGQNGSGKTCLIQAINLIKDFICAEPLPKHINEYFYNGCNTMSFVITYSIENNSIINENTSSSQEIYEYHLTIKKNTDTNFDIPIFSHNSPELQELIIDINKQNKSDSNLIIDETLVIRSSINGSTRTLIKIENGNISSDFRYEIDFQEFEGIIYLSKKDKSSFIFNKNSLLKLLELTRSSKKLPLEVVKNRINFFNSLATTLKYFKDQLSVYKNSESAFTNSNIAIPLSYRSDKKDTYSKIYFSLDKKKFISSEKIYTIDFFIKKANIVFNKLIPNLEISLEKSDEKINSDNILGRDVELFSIRNNYKFPFRNESDGIKKIFSLIIDLILVFNDSSFVLVIDEFDANIFEYLLGEILSLISNHGKGQLIFTAHNLRPLEVLNRESIYFTTFNPKNIFIKDIAIDNYENLRDQYIKSIFLSNDDLELYNSGTSGELRRAFRIAGGLINE